VFRVVGFVLRWGVRLFGGMVFFASARCRACCRFCLSCVAWPPRSVGLCFVFNVTDVIEPGAITPHPLPSIGFPCQNHLPGVVLPRAPPTHAFRVLPDTVALVQVMPVISYWYVNYLANPIRLIALTASSPIANTITGINTPTRLPSLTNLNKVLS
jgi:hypothetical protein